MTTLMWFRRDLRLRDNPALQSAFQSKEPIVPFYIHDMDETSHWNPGAASNWYLEQSLGALKIQLSRHGLNLLLLKGPLLLQLSQLAQRTKADRIIWNRIYEPEWERRDKAVEIAMRQSGLETEIHHDHALLKPDTVRNRTGMPYRVFTAFWKAIESRLIHQGPIFMANRALEHPASLTPGILAVPSLTPAELGLTGCHVWHSKLARYWTAGESSALDSLSRALSRLENYPYERDFPALGGTSGLSAALHFGEISPWRIIDSLRPAWSGDSGSAAARGAASMARQLGWREFAIHLLNAFPQSPEHSLRPEFDSSEIWVENSDMLEAWQRGKTGFALVDAGMRQLWETGWMHNRVRMVTVSFLTKHLGQHWLSGARWFWDTLVDADLANNSLGCQWVAGCGCDAAPYYRIFNPERQSQRFDPDAEYARRWLDSGDSSQPKITDLARARDLALSRYKQLQRG